MKRPPSLSVGHGYQGGARIAERRWGAGRARCSAAKALSSLTDGPQRPAFGRWCVLRFGLSFGIASTERMSESRAAVKARLLKGEISQEAFMTGKFKVGDVQVCGHWCALALTKVAKSRSYPL